MSVLPLSSCVPISDLTSLASLTMDTGADRTFSLRGRLTASRLSMWGILTHRGAITDVRCLRDKTRHFWQTQWQSGRKSSALLARRSDRHSPFMGAHDL